jgi:hypothetical protein
MTLLADQSVYQVAQMISTLKRTFTYRRITPGTGPNPTNTYVDYTVYGISKRITVQVFDGTITQNVSRRITLLPIDRFGNAIPVPNTEDLVIEGATEYRVVQSFPLQAADRTVCFGLNVQ